MHHESHDRFTAALRGELTTQDRHAVVLPIRTDAEATFFASLMVSTSVQFGDDIAVGDKMVWAVVFDRTVFGFGIDVGDDEKLRRAGSACGPLNSHGWQTERINASVDMVLARIQ